MAQKAASSPPAPAVRQGQAAPAHPGRRHGFRHTYGALDLGTNNCRLLVARPADGGFVVVDAFSRVVRLGEGLAMTGRLSDAAIERAIAALSICADKLRRRRVSLARSVATEACRRAENGGEFVARVYDETGIALDVIEPEEEARLAMLGCHRLLEPGDGPALIFDIGGGSTELVLVDTDGAMPKIKSWWSAPWGVVSLTESEGRDFASAEERLAAYGRMRERVRYAFVRFAEQLPAGRENLRLMGTSGTVTTLASVHLALPSYDRRAVDGLIVPADSMRTISQMLSGMSREERSGLACIGGERADLVVAGCAILEAILDIWPARTLGVADRGIREGILRSLMARDGHPV
ncbi:MAG TPA: Ppx/GppA phosphatase family protein [Allosphingosinicella sp.]|nr:Ppx/GppA phosphatase family protein [Allosphingosinicella sp.]